MQINESKVNDSTLGCGDFPDVNRIKVEMNPDLSMPKAFQCFLLAKCHK